MSLVEGTVLGERYQLASKIASGGMGEVWRTEDLLLGRSVALKAMHPGLSGDPGFAERFRAEARNTARLSHPGIADVYDYGEAIDPSGGRRAFLIMQLVDGEPLSALLDNGPLDARRTMDILSQAALALGAAHRAGVIHRDVKPGNLLVRRDGTVVVTDFGIARTVDSAGMTATGQVLGTAAYISPEQAEGKPASPLSDIYSLGVVGYQCLTGRRPFEGENPITVAMAHLREEPPPLPPDIPVAAAAVIERSMAREPGLRFATGEEMAEAAHGAAAAPWDDRLAAATTQMLSNSGPNRTALFGGAAAGGAAGAGAGVAGFRGSATPMPPGGYGDNTNYGGYPTAQQGYGQGGYDEGYDRGGYGSAGSPGYGGRDERRGRNAYDDDGYDRGYGDDDRRSGGTGRKIGVAALVVAASVLAVVLGAWAAFNIFSTGDDQGSSDPSRSASVEPTASETSAEPSPSESEESPSSTPSESESSEPETVNVNAGQYVGEDYDQVAEDLRNKGLRVQRVDVDPTKPGAKKDVVTRVTPSGAVERNSIVRVYAYSGDYEDPTESESPSSSVGPSATASQASFVLRRGGGTTGLRPVGNG